MISLWLIFLALSLVASAFIIWPLWQSNIKISYPEETINKTWYQNRLQELENAFAEKTIDLACFKQNKIQLQKDFLSMVDEKHAYSSKALRLPALLITLGFCGLAFLTYQHLGASQSLRKLDHAKQEQIKIEAEIKSMGGESAVIQKLKQRLKDYPNEAQGWYLLGRIYFSQNDYAAAVKIFEKAHDLASSRIDIATELAEASYLSPLKSDQAKALTRLQWVLKLDPANPTALNLSALMLYHQGKYTQAINIWKNLLAETPVGSTTAKALQTAIVQAQAKIA